jgi:hypothetical protein
MPLLLVFRSRPWETSVLLSSGYRRVRRMAKRGGWAGYSMAFHKAGMLTGLVVKNVPCIAIVGPASTPPGALTGAADRAGLSLFPATD